MEPVALMMVLKAEHGMHMALAGSGPAHADRWAEGQPRRRRGGLRRWASVIQASLK